MTLGSIGHAISHWRQSMFRSQFRVAAAAGVVLAFGICTHAYAQTPVKIQFWDMPWGPAEYIDTAKGLVAQFNKSHPAIQVEYRSVPWTHWYQTYLTAIQAGSAPDVSTGAGYQAVQFYDMDAIRPLDDLINEMKKDGDLKDFRAGSVERMAYKGHTMALPWGIDLRVWYYRKDVLEANKQPIPKTWAELRTVAKAVSGSGKFGVTIPGDTLGAHTLVGMALNNGGGLFTFDGQPDLKSPRNTEAFKFLSDLVADGSVNPASAGASSQEAVRTFIQGKTAFHYDNPGLELQAGSNARHLGVLAPLSAAHGDKGTLGWVNNLMVYKKAKHPEAVKTFIKWWSKNQKALFLAGKVTMVPARVSLAEDAVVKNRAPSFTVATDAYLPVMKGTGAPVAGIFPKLNEVEGDGFLQNLSQRISQKRPLPAALTEADTQFKDVMAQ
jgi:multiple sugar transport system substrate-binding protein